jgi:hypothetical protein
VTNHDNTKGGGVLLYNFKILRALVARLNKRALAERDHDALALTMTLDELLQDAECAGVRPRVSAA